MKKFFTMLFVTLALGATSVAQADNNGGALLGGIIGAVVGNQVGGGNGRVAATAVGAIIGAQVGGNMNNRPPQARRAVYHPPQQYGSGGDPELEAARAQGRAERERAARAQAIQAAYQCGRDGSC